jgi:protein-S-isoprenylcysteine O-methyltransferase Ste14
MFKLALLWISWCILHSLFITTRVNNWFKHKGGLYLALYRPGYIFFSILSLAPVLWYQYTLPQQMLFSWSGYWHLPQSFLLIYALTLFWSGKKNYDMNFFLGLTQWRDYKQGQPTQPLPFRCSGVLQYIRHPWYSGGIVILWALGSITDVSLVGKSILTLYLITGTLLEEKKLKQELGGEYNNYCRQVPILIPWKGKVAREKLPTPLHPDRTAYDN